MKNHLRLGPFVCVLSVAATLSQPLIGQQTVPDIRAAQPDGKPATYVIFDFPGSFSIGAPIGIDAAGTLVGNYYDNTSTQYGFYRLADGSIHRLRPEHSIALGQAEAPAAVAADGTITGSFQSALSGNYIGFIRDRVGNYTEFSAFDSATTFPSGINPAGIVAGFYDDPVPPVEHGFVRDSEGNFTSFDGQAPNGTAVFTRPAGINSEGSIVGNAGAYTITRNDIEYWGFLRDSTGKMNIINPLQSTDVFVTGIADDGSVIGYIKGDSWIGFIRDPQGNYTTFAVPVTNTLATIPIALDPQGSILGGYEVNNVFQGCFYRLQDGTFGFCNPPGSTNVIAAAISAKGDITGTFADAAGNYHFFIRINPDPPATATNPGGDTNSEPTQ
jgi:hypothetical protein